MNRYEVLDKARRSITAATLADLAGVTVRTASRALNTQHEYGYLDRHRIGSNGADVYITTAEGERVLDEELAKRGVNP